MYVAIQAALAGALVIAALAQDWTALWIIAALFGAASLILWIGKG